MRPRKSPRSIREAKGLSREQVAANAGIAFNTVASSEQRGRWPKQLRTRQRYLAALGLTESDIAPERKART